MNEPMHWRIWPWMRLRETNVRQVVLDTETTGLEVRQGHRIIEIGCVEIVDRKLTGRHYHQYVRPERAIAHLRHAACRSATGHRTYDHRAYPTNTHNRQELRI